MTPDETTFVAATMNAMCDYCSTYIAVGDAVMLLSDRLYVCAACAGSGVRI
ncbi:hypothetical protein [Williamsia sp. M5A3_1d]